MSMGDSPPPALCLIPAAMPKRPNQQGMGALAKPRPMATAGSRNPQRRQNNYRQTKMTRTFSTRLRLVGCSFFLSVAVVVGHSPAAEFEWQTATPESQGMSQAKLDALRDGIAKT